MPEWLASVTATKRWHVPELIGEDAIVLVDGPRKRARKSLLVNHLLMCISSGRPLIVERAPVLPVVQAPCVYFEEEGQQASTKLRWLMQIKGAGLEPQDLKQLYFGHRTGIKLDNPDWPEKVIRFCDNVGAKVVAFDPFNYLFSGDESRSADVKLPLENLRAIRNTGRTVIIIHHVGKTSPKPNEQHVDMDDRSRGSSMIVDAYDNHLALSAVQYDPTVRMDVRHRDGGEAAWQLDWNFTGDVEIGLTLRRGLAGPGAG